MLKEMLVKSGAVRFGDFVLASGKRSKYYVDIKKASTKVDILRYLATKLGKYVQGDYLAGVELGAVPLTVATALQTGRDYLIIRKESKSHGTRKLIEGDFKKGSVVDIIEDVVTTGGSVLRAIKILRDEGLKVQRVICVVDRQEGGKDALEAEGVELISLITAMELLK